MLLVGTHQITAQLFQAFFYVNLAELPELVRTGRLDLMLLLPVDAQFAVSTRKFGMDNIVNALVGVAIVIFSLVQAARRARRPARSPFTRWPSAFGVAVHYAVLFGLATVAFWIVRAQGLIYGYFNVFNIARYPDGVFHAASSRPSSAICIPVIIVANVPARILARALESPWTGLAQLAGLAFSSCSPPADSGSFALRRYSSRQFVEKRPCKDCYEPLASGQSVCIRKIGRRFPLRPGESHYVTRLIFPESHRPSDPPRQFMAKSKPAKSAAKSKKAAPAKAVKSAKKPAAKAAENRESRRQSPGEAARVNGKPKHDAPAKARSQKRHRKPSSSQWRRPNGEPAKTVVLTPFLKKQQERLLQLRDSMLDSMMGVAKDNLRTRAEGSEASAFGMHQADAGSDAYDRDFALSLLSQEQDALYEIEEALKRIDLGTYGICEMSGKPIAHARLEALPFARYTVECQSQIEKKGKVTRARVPVTSLFGLTDEEGGGSRRRRTSNRTQGITLWPANSSSSNARKRKPKANPSRATSPRATRRARTPRTGSKRRNTTRT